jgi:putative AlgH/UPF0301 family transcriptional regulator
MLEGMGIAPDGESKIDLRVHYGGPVEPSRAFVLHSPEYHAPDTVVLSDQVALTLSPRILEDIAAGKGPKRSLFALGYAGWGPEQLEGELAAGAWVVVEPTPTCCSRRRHHQWQRAFDRRGLSCRSRWSGGRSRSRRTTTRPPRHPCPRWNDAKRTDTDVLATDQRIRRIRLWK